MAKEVKDKKNEKSKDKKNFAKDFKAELKKVSWPNLKQLVNNTTAVIVIVLITAAIVFVLDVVFESLNNYGVEKLKAIVTSSTVDEAKENTDAEVEESADKASESEDTSNEQNVEETSDTTTTENPEEESEQ